MSKIKEYTHDDVMRSVTQRIKQMCSSEHIYDWSAAGYSFAFSSVQGDLKWINENYKLHDFRNNSCCSLCGAEKKNADLSMTIADFRSDAKHVGTAPNLTAFHNLRPAIFEIATVDRVLHDCMHSQLLAKSPTRPHWCIFVRLGTGGHFKKEEVSMMIA